MMKKILPLLSILFFSIVLSAQDEYGIEEIDNLTFESALKALEEIVSQLDDGAIELDKAVEAYEKGAKLKKHCEKKLKEAQQGSVISIP